MKYWRGYLVAGILALCSWALCQFSAAHTQLVDMVYPYITRIIMDYLAGWSAGVSGCLWQTLLIAMLVGLIIAILQAATQVHEQTLTFAPKAVIVALALLAMGPWMCSSIIDFFNYIVGLMAEVGL